MIEESGSGDVPVRNTEYNITSSREEVEQCQIAKKLTTGGPPVTLGETEFLKKLAMLGPGLAPDGPVSGPGFLPGLFLFSDNFDFFMLLHFCFWRK